MVIATERESCHPVTPFGSGEDYFYDFDERHTFSKLKSFVFISSPTPISANYAPLVLYLEPNVQRQITTFWSNLQLLVPRSVEGLNPVWFTNGLCWNVPEHEQLPETIDYDGLKRNLRSVWEPKASFSITRWRVPSPQLKLVNCFYNGKV